MKPLEEELRNALRRQEPPEGFSRRVMANISSSGKAGSENPLRWFFRNPVFRWAAACVVGALLFAGLVANQHRAQRRAEARRDSQQALLALRITSLKLNEAFAAAAYAGRHAPGDPAKSDSMEE